MASGDTDDDVISIAVVILSGAFVNESKKKANKRKRSIWTCRWIKQREKHGAHHSLVTKQKVTKQTTTVPISSFNRSTHGVLKTA